MRSQIILGIAVFLIFGAMAQRGYTTIVPWSGLPNLVIKSDFIATGTVSTKGVKTILITDRILKGQVPKEVTIVNVFKIRRLETLFTENENVLLFMTSIGADSACLTSDYMAKWPRDTITEYSNILDTASVDSIIGLVNQILRIESETDINDRVDILRGWLDSSNSLLNLVALQYSLSSHIWPKGFSPDYKKGITRANIRKQLSGYAFKLIQSDSPSVQAESIRLLRYTNPERALPVLISKITDPNRRVREFTRTELNIFAGTLKTGEGFKYNSVDATEELLSVQRKWQEWYDANYNK